MAPRPHSIRPLCAALCAGLALAAAPGPGAADLSGAWSGTITLADRGTAWTGAVLHLSQERGQVRGFLLLPPVRAELAVSGRLQGRRLSLASTPVAGISIAMEGQVRNAHAMAGEATVIFHRPTGQRRERSRVEWHR